MSDTADRRDHPRQPCDLPGPLERLRTTGEAVRHTVESALADLRIEGQIQAALDVLLPLTGLEVDVDSDHGVVYLRGEVESAWQKDQAERITRDLGLAEVRAIVNEVVVNPDLPPMPHP